MIGLQVSVLSSVERYVKLTKVIIPVVETGVDSVVANTAVVVVGATTVVVPSNLVVVGASVVSVIAKVVLVGETNKDKTTYVVLRHYNGAN